jgi:hypothetical protein
MINPINTAPQKPAISKNAFLLILSIGLLTMVHWLILILRIPVFDSLPRWFFLLRETPIQVTWVFIAFIALGASIFATFSKTRVSIKLILLIILGAVIQFSFAFSKGQGLEPLRNRMIGVGHAEFAAIASRQTSMWNVARNYEYLLQNNEITSAYTRSKPPGTLLFYMFSERLANLTSPNAAPEQRLENLQTFASVTWPFITYLVFIPLFFFARRIYDEETALMACLFYLCVPPVNLITIHTDQTIYPFLAVLPVWLATLACAKRNYLLAFLSGITFYLAVYFSFGLAMIFLFISLPYLLEWIKDLKNWKRISLMAGSTALGIIASDILARLVLGYNIYIRYADAIKHHIKWKEWEGGFGNLLRAGLTASTEFFVWLGIPLTILLFVAIGLALYQTLICCTADSTSLFSLALFGTFILLLLFGKTRVESARLWLFLVPFICIAAAHFIHERAWTAKSKILFVIYILLLELGTVYFILRHMDFQ